VDSAGDLTKNGVWQNMVKMPSDKFVIYSHSNSFQNFYGESDLKAAYNSWWVKTNLFRVLPISMERFAERLAGRDVSAVYASTERKAMDGGAIVAERLGLSYDTDKDLGENDRSSTGFIAPPEFWDVVREFFGNSHESIRGWERAIDAQTRIVNAIGRILREDETSGDIVVVSHGGVGCLLTAHLQRVEIGKESRPSHPGGGCFIRIDRDSFALTQDWRTIEDGFAA